MSRKALQVGAFTWSRIQRLLYDADPDVHWQRCEAEGFGCPQKSSRNSFMKMQLCRPHARGHRSAFLK
jgi:hypothetical protein